MALVASLRRDMDKDHHDEIAYEVGGGMDSVRDHCGASPEYSRKELEDREDQVHYRASQRDLHYLLFAVLAVFFRNCHGFFRKIKTEI